jgi:hypothetical protein
MGTAPAPNNTMSPYALARALDDCAKRWWGTSLLVKVGGFTVGACIDLLPAVLVASVVAVCTVVAELCMVRSDAMKSRGQQFRRKLDLQDGLGWQIPKTDLSDFLVRCSWWVKKRARAHPANEPYFASTDPPGPIRALSNVCESGWWTKHLSEWMAAFCWALVVIGVVGSVVLLIAALQATKEHSLQMSVARIVTAFLMLFLSLGLIKLALGYGSLSKNSGTSEQAADRALQASTTLEELTAFKVMYDYHLNRAAGPLIPTWMWKLREAELNRTWKEHRCKS